MKKKNRTIPFTKMWKKIFCKNLLFILPSLIFISWSFAQEVNKYPPYPDVWEREFVDYFDREFSFFKPVGGGEVLIYQSGKVDRNGEPLKDSKGKLIDLRNAMLFFTGEFVSNYQENEIYLKTHISREEYENFRSCGISSRFFSDYAFLKDGSKTRWIKGLVFDRYNNYGQKGKPESKEVNGILLDHKFEYKFNISYHTTYYNKPIVLEKVDKDGKVLWQKIYLYFHPWWGHREPRFMETKYDDFYSFYYFKLGCLAVIDEDRMFVYFDGTKKIFRLGLDGKPKTEDRNLIVMDYQDYKALVEKVIDKMDKFQQKQREKRTIDLIPCRIPVEDGRSYYTISDYDYLGEQLIKKLSIPIESKVVNEIKGEYKSLDKCINSYRQMERFN